MMFRLVRIRAAAVSGLLGVFSLITTTAQTNEVTFQEVSLGKVPPRARLDQVILSRDNAHVAYPVQPGRIWNVVHDGQQDAVWDAVRDLQFSPNGSRLAYVARRGTNECVVLDGTNSPPFQAIGPGCLAFSPDSKRFVFIAWISGKWSAVLDGRPGPGYDRIAKVGFTFSSDSRHFAYAALRGKQSFWITDSAESVPGDGVGPFRFSPDGTRTGWLAPRGETWIVVVDGKAKECDQVAQEGVIFSPDSRHAMYASGGDKLQVFVDDVGRDKFDRLAPGFMAFSPENGRVVVGGLRGEKWRAVIDGQESPEYEGLMANSLVFSPDGKHIAYAVLRTNHWSMIIDGTPGTVYDGIAAKSMSFSPDSRHYGYLAGRADKFVAVLDGKETAEYPAMGAQGVVYSADSKRSAFVAQQGTNWQAVVDGKASNGYTGIGLRPFDFSPDNRHFAFAATRDGKFFLVVDGRESPGYDQLLINTGEGASFGAFHVLAIKTKSPEEHEIVRVEALAK